MMNTEEAWEYMGSKRGASVRRKSGGPEWRRVWDATSSGGMVEGCSLDDFRERRGFTVSTGEPGVMQKWVEGVGHAQLGPGSWRYAFEGITDWVECEWRDR